MLHTLHKNYISTTVYYSYAYFVFIHDYFHDVLFFMLINDFDELNWKKKSKIVLIKTGFVFHRERKMRLLVSWTQSRTGSKWPKPRKIAWSKKRNMWARNSIDFLRNSIGKYNSVVNLVWFIRNSLYHQICHSSITPRAPPTKRDPTNFFQFHKGTSFKIANAD